MNKLVGEYAPPYTLPLSTGSGQVSLLRWQPYPGPARGASWLSGLLPMMMFTSGPRLSCLATLSFPRSIVVPFFMEAGVYGVQARIAELAQKVLGGDCSTGAMRTSSPGSGRPIPMTFTICSTGPTRSASGLSDGT